MSEPATSLREVIRQSTLRTRKDQKCGACGFKEAFHGWCSKCSAKNVVVMTHAQQLEMGARISWCGTRLQPIKRKEVRSGDDRRG
jgi:hypothetical protein